MNINGNEHSWASVKVRFGSTEVTDIKAVKYADELDGADDFNLQMLRDFIEDCQQEKKKMQAALAPPAPPMAPPGAATPQAPALPDLGIPAAPPPMAA